MAVIRGESCFEKNAFKVTENPHPQNSTSGERISREMFEISKKPFFVLKLFIRPILFHGKISFDNLTNFEQYGNLKGHSRLIFRFTGVFFQISLSEGTHSRYFIILQNGPRKLKVDDLKGPC